METKKLGNFGERIAENYLRNKGYQILERNYLFRIPGSPQKGEIDIIAKKEDITSFIEVKTLTEKNFSLRPEDKINFSKRKKLRITAESWLMKNKIPLNSKWQIDVISVKIMPDRKIKIWHFQNAISY